MVRARLPPLPTHPPTPKKKKNVSGYYITVQSYLANQNMVILAVVFKTILFHLVIKSKPFQVDLCSTALTNNIIPEYQLYCDKLNK
jgi:hypothetical protein